jgi:hypothetical protein
MTERQLQECVRRTAEVFGWLHYHTHNSRRSEFGFPDSVMVRGNRLIVAELKSERGKVTDAQAQWLAGFLFVPGVEIHVWRPSQWFDGTIEEVLR